MEEDMMDIEKKDFCAEVAAQLMLKEIQKGSAAKNIVLSPLSFTAILNMIAGGATGPTLKQMLEYLAVEDTDDLNKKFLDMAAVATSKSNEGPDVCFLNGIWVQEELGLKNSYQELVKNVYNATARSVDFKRTMEVIEEANSWAKSATKGLITEVLKPGLINAGSKLLLGNALYFKGSWTDNFNERLTKNKDFHLLNGDKVSVPFMTGCHKYLYELFESYEAVKIPYRKGNDKREFSMYFFLPNERDGLSNLLKKVNSDSNFFTQKFNLQGGKLDAMYIPKFKFSFTTLRGLETMREMGLTLPFSSSCRDLTEIVESAQDLYVDMIIQKAFVEIDEKGTEAAAVTFASMTFGCAMTPRPLKIFIADHPFLFMIREETTSSVLFTGAVVNPLLIDSDGNEAPPPGNSSVTDQQKYHHQQPSLSPFSFNPFSPFGGATPQFGTQPPAGYPANFGPPLTQQPPFSQSIYGWPQNALSTQGLYGQPPPVNWGYMQPAAQPGYAQFHFGTQQPPSAYDAPTSQPSYRTPPHGAPHMTQPSYGQQQPPP